MVFKRLVRVLLISSSDRKTTNMSLTSKEKRIKPRYRDGKMKFEGVRDVPLLC